jgi:hypothetical protein
MMSVRWGVRRRTASRDAEALESSPNRPHSESTPAGTSLEPHDGSSVAGVWMEIGGRPFGCSMIWIEIGPENRDSIEAPVSD